MVKPVDLDKLAAILASVESRSFSASAYS
jgi:hypothetical protein